MIDLSVKILGLEIKNPIIVGSSDLTNSLESLKKLEKYNAGAIVLKSVFEEQIMMSINKTMSGYTPFHSHTETSDYLRFFEKRHILDKYLELIKGAKEEIKIPVIASINCMTLDDWTSFALDIERAGADAVELNVMTLDTDPHMIRNQAEETLEIAKAVTSRLNIPVILKISFNDANLAHSILEYSCSGISALTVFNKTMNPDIDIDKEEIVTGYPLSNKAEFSNTLRWTAIAAGFAECDLISSTGIHGGEEVVKSILAGATAVQMVSSLHLESEEVIGKSLAYLNKWMERKGYNNLNEFRGKLKKGENNRSSFYGRIQYMEYLKSRD